MSPRGSTVGLFAGIGGIELGLEQSGFKTELLCEIDQGARAVLQERFDDAPLHHDVTTLKSLPSDCTVLAAGFPCQDLSQAGRGGGIGGRQSGLVDHVFRLLDQRKRKKPRWLVLENVPFMLHLDKGQAMRLLTSELSNRGYRWAYRTVDARAFGVPQRRRRVLLLASTTEDPRPALLDQDEVVPAEPAHEGRACGFYWTEGNTGLGWAVDAVPTIKGGSGLGIPSPPAIWLPDGSIVTPDIRDTERLQGFDADWTLPATEVAGLRDGVRWKLVGNAVCVPMAKWLGERLDTAVVGARAPSRGPVVADRWPPAAWGESDRAHAASVGDHPIIMTRPKLSEFLRHEPRPLSQRAINGFRNRLAASGLRYPEDFMTAIDRSLDPAPLATNRLRSGQLKLQFT